jgi:hypothetical protein
MGYDARMRFFASLTPFLLGAAAAAFLCLPFVGSGCGRTACITLTDDERTSGICPSVSAAGPRFGVDSNCPGAISSVDGEGTFDGSFCCYPVTPLDGAGDFGCVSGVGGFGGFGTATGTGGGFGTGGFGTGGSCQLCQQIFQGFSIDPAQLCPTGSGTAFNSLVMCGCSSTASCIDVCQNTLCFGLSPDPSCLSCIFADTTCNDAVASCNVN